MATVEGAAPIERAAVDRWTAISAARDDDAAPAELRERVMAMLLRATWLRAEAASLGVTPTPFSDEQMIALLLEDAYPSEAALRESLRRTGASMADLRFEVETEIIDLAVQARLAPVAPVTRRDVAAHYRRHRKDYIRPEHRDIVMVQTKRRSGAVAALRAIRGGRRWASVARRYSVDPLSWRDGRSNGHLRRGGLPVLDAAVFRARRGELVGPLKAPEGWYVFKVLRIHPAYQPTLKEAEATIRMDLLTARERAARDGFVAALRGTWRPRTRCLQELLTQDCGATLPPPAPPA